MSTEIPIWVNGKIRWLSGIDKKTTCRDVVEVLLTEEGIDKSEAKDFTIMERWKKMERQLDENSKILKIWTHWGSEKKEVRLCLRRTDNEVDSGRGSPVTSGYIPSLRRKRNRIQRNGKPPWAHKETLHPRRLAELGRYDGYPHVKNMQSEDSNDHESVNTYKAYENKVYEDASNYLIKSRESQSTSSRRTSGHRSYHCSNTGKLHSTPFSQNYSKKAKCCNRRESKQRVRNSENIENLMKLILVQGATIQSQLQKLKEREEQIDSLEQERHRERIEKNGRNYLLETYLGSLKDAEIPEDLNEAKNGNKNTSLEKIKQNDPGKTAEFRVVKDSKFNVKTQLWLRDEEGFLVKPQNKTTRSNSESRAQESKSEENLKRTCSDNAIAEIHINHDYERASPTSENTKEEYENLIELKRIQSQIEMWEKVFKINQKLEQEEENLVRLHIKIKKVQEENYRIAKGNFDNSEKLQEKNVPSFYSEVHVKINDLEKIQEEKNCETLQKNLETLKSDIEDNSKEIYKNFTRLIEEDEIVTQKRCCLSEIVTDLERTNHEYEMLNDMLAMRENQNIEQERVSSLGKGISNFENNNFKEIFSQELPTENDLNLQKLELEITESPEADNLCLNSLVLSHAQDNINQRTETNVDDHESKIPIKTKIVKISFEDKLQNYENSQFPKENFSQGSNPVPTGALKSILKNRTHGYSEMFHLQKEFQKYQDVSSNFECNNNAVTPQKNLKMKNSYIQNSLTDAPNRVHCNYTTYPYTIPYPLYENFPQKNNKSFSVHLPKLSNINNLSHLKNSYSTKINPTHFSHSALVTTKVLVHNDTDSSTSSDTSGLSSMYSSSITNEEPFVGKNYVLDTLV